MKTIYNKLDPKILASINKDAEKYPHTHRSIIKALKEAHDWTQLMMMDIQTIINHSHYSFWEISMRDVMFGDKFLTNGVGNNK